MLNQQKVVTRDLVLPLARAKGRKSCRLTRWIIRGVCVTAAVFHSRVVYGFSNKDYGYCAIARRPLEGIYLQRCRDGVMNECLFWCRHPLVPLLFHEVTSLYPLHFREMIFSLVVVTDEERLSITPEEVLPPRQPEDSQEEVEGNVKSKYYSCPAFVNPRRARAARVTVLGLSVCLSVRPSTTILGNGGSRNLERGGFKFVGVAHKAAEGGR